MFHYLLVAVFALCLWLLCAYRNRHGRRVPAKKVSRRTRLELQVIEDRTVPAPFTFTGGGGNTDWGDVRNWNDTGRQATTLPGPNDDVTIPNGLTAVLSSSEDANILSLTVTGATLTVNGPMDVSNGAVFSGGGSVTIGSSGTLDDSGTLDSSIAPGGGGIGLNVLGTLDFDGNSPTGSISSNLNVAGTMEAGNNATISGSVTIGGVLDAKNISGFSGAAVTLTGTGTVLDGGNIETGVLASATFATGSAYTIASGGQLHGDGTYVIDAPLTVAGALNPGAIELNNDGGGTTTGAVAGTGDLDLTDEFTWTGGTVSVAGGVTVETNTKFSVDGPDACTLATDLDTTSLFFDISSPLTIASGDVLANGTGGSKVSLSSSILGPGTFDNPGTLAVESSTVAPSISAVFNDSGIIDVGAGAKPLTLSGTGTLAGEVTLNGDTLTITGAYTVAANTTLETAYDPAPGVVNLNPGGTLTVGAGAEAEFDYFVLGGGTIAGAGTVAIGATNTHPDDYMDWNAGTLSGTGTLDIHGIINNNVNQGPTLNIGYAGDPNTLTLNGWTIANSGIANWYGGTISLTDFVNGSSTTSPSIDNEGAALFKDEGSGTFTSMSPAATFDNHGYFLKDTNSGAGTLTLPVTFTNDPSGVGAATNGLVEVKNGTLSVSDGGSSTGTFQADSGTSIQFATTGYTLEDGGGLAGAGTIINAATLTVSGSTTISGGVTLANGPRDQIEVSADMPAGSGGGTISNAGTFTTTATTSTATIGAVLNSTGTVETQGGTLTLAGGGSSSGQFQVATGTTLQFAQQGYTITNGFFMGSGTIDNQTHLTLAGMTDIDQPVTNEGTLEVQGGTLYLEDGGSSASGSTFTSDSGAAVNFANGTYTLGGGTALSGSGTFEVTGGQVVATGAVTGASGTSLTLSGGTLEVTDAGSLQVGSFTEQAGGTLKIDLGASGYGTLDAQGAAALAGALDVVLTGYVPKSGDNLPILDYASYTGSFGSMTVPSGLDYVYNATNFSVYDPS